MIKIAENKKGFYDYFILDKLEAGLVLTGTEVKSIRLRKVALKDGFVNIIKGELYLENVHISEFKEGNMNNHEPMRRRKLLLHKKEIDKLIGKIKEDGLTVIPLKLYIDDRGRVKVEIAVAKGKKQYDKRESIKKRDAGRMIEKVLKDRNRD